MKEVMSGQHSDNSAVLLGAIDELKEGVSDIEEMLREIGETTQSNHEDLMEFSDTLYTKMVLRKQILDQLETRGVNAAADLVEKHLKLLDPADLWTIGEDGWCSSKQLGAWQRAVDPDLGITVNLRATLNGRETYADVDVAYGMQIIVTHKDRKIDRRIDGKWRFA